MNDCGMSAHEFAEALESFGEYMQELGFYPEEPLQAADTGNSISSKVSAPARGEQKTGV